MPVRTPINMQKREEFIAKMVVDAYNDLKGSGKTLDQIGIPPLTANPKTCSGHSWKGFCPVCHLNFCYGCPNIAIPTDPGIKTTMWAGSCGDCENVPSTEHHERVMEIVKSMLANEEADVAQPPMARSVVAPRTAMLAARKVTSVIAKKRAALKHQPAKNLRQTASDDEEVDFAGDVSPVAKAVRKPLPVARAADPLPVAIAQPMVDAAVEVGAQIAVDGDVSVVSSNVTVERTGNGQFTLKFAVTIRTGV